MVPMIQKAFPFWERQAFPFWERFWFQKRCFCIQLHTLGVFGTDAESHFGNARRSQNGNVFAKLGAMFLPYTVCVLTDFSARQRIHFRRQIPTSTTALNVNFHKLKSMKRGREGSVEAKHKTRRTRIMLVERRSRFRSAHVIYARRIAAQLRCHADTYHVLTRVNAVCIKKTSGAGMLQLFASPAPL